MDFRKLEQLQKYKTIEEKLIENLNKNDFSDFRITIHFKNEHFNQSFMVEMSGADINSVTKNKLLEQVEIELKFTKMQLKAQIDSYEKLKKELNQFEKKLGK